MKRSVLLLAALLPLVLGSCGSRGDSQAASGQSRETIDVDFLLFGAPDGDNFSGADNREPDVWEPDGSEPGTSDPGKNGADGMEPGAGEPGGTRPHGVKTDGPEQGETGADGKQPDNRKQGGDEPGGREPVKSETRGITAGRGIIWA